MKIETSLDIYSDYVYIRKSDLIIRETNTHAFYSDKKISLMYKNYAFFNKYAPCDLSVLSRDNLLFAIHRWTE